MKTSPRSLAIACCLTAAPLVLVACLPAGAAAAQPGDEPSLRSRMDRIFESLSRAFILSLDEEAFVARSNRREILADLRALADESARLDAHGAGLDPSLEYLRRTMSADARDAARHFRQKDHESARFALRQLTENCIACHAKLPAGDDARLGARLIEEPAVRTLIPEERVRVELLAHRFDDALATYESILRSPAVAPAEVYFMGAFEGYLKACLLAKVDRARALSALAEFSGREDLPAYLIEYVSSWMGELRALEQDPPSGDKLAEARRLLDEARDLQQYPDDRRGLVRCIVASGLLRERIASGGGSPVDAAETWYLLGVAEENISRLSWLSEKEFFLEKAIRTAPGSDPARRAFLLLEEILLSSHMGSGGVSLPPEVSRRLDDLRALID